MEHNDQFIRQVLELSRRMIILADEGQAEAHDDGCRLLSGILQDCAYRLRLQALQERQSHDRAAAKEEVCG
ncbi:MAG: hypothetical protein A2521_16330 [Deltaproteobacteria bacterium RIFOXYD12_FULL_57_12]|nr:MAG: hypothetical protein A2521_16330 [Deltaproteobacteria bacterium RIFOXYD12_FULL_57_12]